MIVGIALRLLPFLPVLLAGGVALGGFGLNWWLEFTDWKTAAIFAGALIACVYVVQTDKPWARLAVVGIIGVAMYLKGGVDKEADLTVKHEAEVALIHKTVKDAADAERARQRQANAQALAEAAKQKEEQDVEMQRLQSLVDSLTSEASKDANADRPALGLEAVKRLNRLRFGDGVWQQPGS